MNKSLVKALEAIGFELHNGNYEIEIDWVFGSETFRAIECEDVETGREEVLIVQVEWFDGKEWIDDSAALTLGQFLESLEEDGIR